MRNLNELESNHCGGGQTSSNGTTTLIDPHPVLFGVPIRAVANLVVPSAFQIGNAIGNSGPVQSAATAVGKQLGSWGIVW